MAAKIWRLRMSQRTSACHFPGKAHDQLDLRLGRSAATGTVDGSSLELSAGSYVDFQRRFPSRAPATGYVVDTGAMVWGDLAYTDGSSTTTDKPQDPTIDNVQEDSPSRAQMGAWNIMPSPISGGYQLGRSEGSTNGTLSASTP